MTEHTKQGHVIPRALKTDTAAYRFWFNQNTRNWCVSPAEGAGAQFVATKNLQLCEVDVKAHPDGTMTCVAQLLVDDASARIAGQPSGIANRITLRLQRIFDQTVVVPVVGAAGARVMGPGT